MFGSTNNLTAVTTLKCFICFQGAVNINCDVYATAETLVAFTCLCNWVFCATRCNILMHIERSVNWLRFIQHVRFIGNVNFADYLSRPQFWKVWYGEVLWSLWWLEAIFCRSWNSSLLWKRQLQEIIVNNFFIEIGCKHKFTAVNRKTLSTNVTTKMTRNSAERNLRWSSSSLLGDKLS